MSLEFNNPLYIGDKDASTKANIEQIKQDIGDLSQLDTADKSSLVNALNEAMDSTLNGASRDLDNLSDEGNEKLRSLNSYANEGELLTDPDGLAFVEKYAHSTFDASKFTVVGSPNITDDGIASGFSSNNYIDTGYTTPSTCYSYKESIEFTTGNDVTTPQVIIGSAENINYGVSYRTFNISLDNGRWLIRITTNGTEWNIAYFDGTITANTKYKLDFEWNGSVYSITVTPDGGTATVIYTVNSANFVIPNRHFIGNSIWQSLNRPFLGQIDLKQFSITVDGVEVFSGNKTGIDTIKPDDYTVAGTPVITSDGILNQATGSNFIYTNTLTLSNDKDIDIEMKVYLLGDHCYVFGGNNGTRFEPLNTPAYGNPALSVLSFAEQFAMAITEVLPENQWITIRLHCRGANSYAEILENGNFRSLSTFIIVNNSFSINEILVIGQFSGHSSNCNIDLNAFKIYVDGNLVYQPCLKIPYTESKTGSKIVQSVYRDRVNDMAEQFGFANYYTLDKGNGNFTLPQVELYGLIGQRTLRDSYRNGINYWELYSNRDLEQGGSCTSGVEVTFARPFADTNYVLSVPYSTKSATAFTPTQTGDWIAKGKGVL